MKKMILVSLTDADGEAHVKLCNEAAKAWFESPTPAAGYVEEVIPADVLFGYEDAVEDEDLLVRVSSGSGKNDRALACPGDAMSSITAAFKYAKTNHIDIVDGYDGMVY
jgi:hypothetical protein